MRYMIVEEHDTDKLSKTVEALLDDGWELQGGPICFEYDQTTVFAQALTNEQDAPVWTASNDEELNDRITKFLAMPEDQLSPEAKERRAELVEILGQALESASAPETDSE